LEKAVLTTGIKGNRELVVTKELTAQAMGSGELPVFATPAVVALAEETAWRSVAAELEPGQVTVGTLLQIEHVSATPVGMKVRCETELTEIDRRKLTFSVMVCDEAGVVAKGTHCRFIVENEKFLGRAEKKAEAAGIKGNS
jgi:predicted thioesterase